ncbi:MAG: hypothetical protein R3A80_07485 [Bdellovibrionota bacterium]
MLHFAHADKGVALRTYLSRSSEEALVKLFWEQKDELSQNLWIENYASKDIKLSTFGCAVMVWRPFEGKEIHGENRIQCHISYTWLDTQGATKYEKSQLVYFLANDEIRPEGFRESPSFSFRGEAAGALLGLLKKEAGPENAYSITSAKDYTGASMYYLESSDDYSPWLVCTDSKNEANCSFTWPQVSVRSAKLSFGDNAEVLAKVLCASGISPDEGVCPQKNEDYNYVECNYEGIEVPVGTWGAVSDSSSIVCSYLELSASTKKNFKFNLGALTVRPRGGRFSPSIGIEISGPKLRGIYKALRSHMIALKQKDSFDEKAYPLSLMSLPGRPPWSVEYISLRTAKDPNEMFAGFNCETKDVSRDPYYRAPEMVDPFGGMDVFVCTIERAYRRVIK